MHAHEHEMLRRKFYRRVESRSEQMLSLENKTFNALETG